jgi:hypothetical protein
MPDYKNGKIYKLTNSDESLVYIGSTTQPLCERKAGHRAKYKIWKRGKSKKHVTSFNIFEANEDDVNIYLIEAYPCNSKEELHAREGYYIRQMECVNKVIPRRTQKEYRKDNKASILAKKKDYREKNRDEIKAKSRAYRARKKASILAKDKKYREKNKDILKAKSRAYRARKKAERECKLYTDIFDGLQAIKTAREARFNSM